MKITIISLNFYPEDTAIGLYSTQMADFLAKKHDIQVVTAFPYYPQWKIYPDYKKKGLFLKEKNADVQIYRSRQYVPATPTFLKRIILMMTFSFGAFYNLFRLKHKPDVIIAVIPFTSSAALALFSKWIFKSKTWIHIQDFEFDAAIESGLMNKKSLIKSFLVKIEKFILDKSDCNSTISHSMLKKLESKSKTKTYFLPNWIDDNFVGSIPERKHSYLDPSKFNILYSGNIGEKQDWELFSKVVKLIPENENIKFIIVGDGARKKRLEEECRDIKSVEFFDPVPFSELSSLLLSTDAHFLFQKNDVVDTVMPSKILGMLASGKISLVTGNKESEVQSIFEKHKTGVFISSGKAEEIVDIIFSIKNNPSNFENLERNAQSYVHENFSKENVLSKFLDTLEEFNIAHEK